MASRPYITWYTPQLRDLVEDNKHDKALLRKVQHELGFRTKQRARRLLAEVDELLGEDSLAEPEDGTVEDERSLQSLVEEHITNESIRQWFLQCTLRRILHSLDPTNYPDKSTDRPGHVATLGDGPLDESEFDEIVLENGINVHPVGEDVEYLVLGHSGWTQEQVLEHVELRRGRTLRVYSQEMLLAWMAYGEDPLDDEDIHMTFAEGHPALQWLMMLAAFKWPTTFVAMRGEEALDTTDFMDRGLLGKIDYHVGIKANRSPSERRGVLAAFFDGKLDMKREVAKDLKRWGSAGSQQRLQSVARAIATHARIKAQDDTRDYSQAVAEWRDDLEWLRIQYHVPRRFSFAWPSTQVRRVSHVTRLPVKRMSWDRYI